ncbi:MAG: transglycosylase domain-containing protein [Erysipelotrichaceae bacterium]
MSKDKIKIVDGKYLRPKKRVSGKFKRLFLIIMSGILVLTMITGTVVLAWANEKISESPMIYAEDFEPIQSSYVYDRNGQVIAELGLELRENITYEQIPQSVIDAFISVEDSRFFTHEGFDIPRFMKSALVNLKNGDFSQGGSTLTMQLIKNAYYVEEESGGASKSIERKLQEIYLSYKVENILNKEDIFTNYVNANNYGGPYRGIEKAAHFYFGKSITQISLSEAAYLAGVINRPNAYNVHHDLSDATARRDEVLDLMFYHGYISELECQIAKSTKLEFMLVKEVVESKINPYQAYIDTVIDEVMKKTGNDPYEVPMHIYTAMNTPVQQLTENILNNKTWINVAMQAELNSATAVVDTKTGEISVLGGGRDYIGERVFNFATDMTKHSGSIIKPVLPYLLAFEYLGYHTGMILWDYPINYQDSSTQVNDWYAGFKGPMTIQSALTWSTNVNAVAALEQVYNHMGEDTILDFMHNIGWDWANSDNYSVQWAVGAASFQGSPLSMASAYQMLLNYGLWIEPHTVRSIDYVKSSMEDYKANPKTNQVVSPAAAWLSASLLTNYSWRQNQSGYTVYGKTGTSDWGDDGAKWGLYGTKDSWLAGATTRNAIVTWTGFDVGKPGNQMWSSTYNYSHPGKINKELLYTLNLTYGANPEPYHRPSGISSISTAWGYFPYVAPGPNDRVTSGLVKDGAAIYAGERYTPEVPDMSSVNLSYGPNKKSYVISLDPKLDPNQLREIGPSDDFFGVNYRKAKPLNPFDLWGSIIYHGTITYNDGKDSMSFGTAIPNYTFTLPKGTTGEVKVCANYSYSRATSIVSKSTVCDTITALGTDDSENP